MNRSSMVQFRMKFLLLATLTAVIGLGYSAINGWIQFTSFQKSLNASYSLEAIVNELKTNEVSDSVHREMQLHRQRISEPQRSKSLSDVIQAYAEKSPALLKKRVKFFLRNEAEFRPYAVTQVEYWEKKILYFSGLAVGSLFFFTFFLYFYIKTSVFRPLSDLSKKMNDFLNNKYSYQFSVPASNEVGHLQATFNALAQRVLANVEELTDLDRAKTEFLNIASHELRTPLTSIKGSLSLLQTGVAGEMSDSSQNLMNIAETETDRLIRLINDVLDLAKIEAGRLPLEKNWTNLDNLLADTVKSLEALSHTANVSLCKTATPQVCVEVDSDRVQQVLTNLISNAIKFSPKEGVVKVSARLLENKVLKISVIDQGRGIPPQDIEKIFEKFSQASGPDNPLVKGTGLGLSIARAIVEEHGGEIQVESTVGKGSEFSFTLESWKLSQVTSTDQAPIEEVAA